ncbi:killing trait [Caedimonas varicaedens]|uniref:Killing trait n=1 Tax=Caedimonas varicaedens TaxID=1629334 RepID=A0A0K8MES7_9PROT|nr:killing trait [Caedimonas varicaedens]
MATQTAVNDQITDAITQTNVKTLGESPAVALSNLYQAVSNSFALGIQNATFAQQQSNMIHQTTTTQGVNLIYAVDTEAVADASTKISRAGIPDNTMNSVLIQSLMGKSPSFDLGKLDPYMRNTVEAALKKAAN